MKSKVLGLLATVALLALSRPVVATPVEWTFDFGPNPSGGPSSIQSGQLWVRFDSDDLRFPPVIRDTWTLVNWLVSDFRLVLNGQEFFPEANRLAPYFGAVGQEQYIRESGRLDVVVVDLDVAGGGRFDLQMIGDFYPYYGFITPATPFGYAPPPPDTFVSYNYAQGVSLQGRVTHWNAVPEPGTLALLGLGLLGLGVTRRRAA